MSLDKRAAERRRFARLLGVDGELGSGLPMTTSGDDRHHQLQEPHREHRPTTDHDDGAPPSSETDGFEPEIAREYEPDIDPDETQSLGAD
ncbi:hypothetical protein G6M89_04490 [Natronolimnobius sp. AArcel1]|uniref:hypothetical protein n=1 Tax=Natronolimnobius sp. AArcel1 TaxID=1679093 RepID=UPI0013EA5CCB|nr:hypothetical protein [Natronolimnobius sp. AArcel1]NGM68274.1 hypothetical protein [Natronolimnobius sp. AArcel1]